MTKIPPGEANPSILVSAEFARAARMLPQVPIAPSAGVVALQHVEQRIWTPRAFAQWPANLRPEDYVVMGRAAEEEHGQRSLPRVDEAQLRRAAGFVTTSLLTTAGQLFHPEGGDPLPNIHKPGENDPAINAAVTGLGNPRNRDTALAVFTSVADTIRDEPEIHRLARIYQDRVTDIALSYGSVEPGTVQFAAKQRDLGGQREWIAEQVEDFAWYDLNQARQAGYVAVGDRRVSIGHLTEEHVEIAVHNITRPTPAPEWFVPAA